MYLINDNLLNKYELNEINFITINFMMKIKYFKLVMIFI